MSQSRPLDGGLDVPKEALAVAYGAHDQDAEVVSLGTVGTRQGALDTLPDEPRLCRQGHRPFLASQKGGGSGHHRPAHALRRSHPRLWPRRRR